MSAIFPIFCHSILADVFSSKTFAAVALTLVLTFSAAVGVFWYLLRPPVIDSTVRPTR
ncbi:MAG: hypothetical protein LBQ81_09425 [Zoogloeaceae bacterium]|nr:hypothetical protein [Zoogloeaceae bacterium]